MKTTTFYGESTGDRARDELTTQVWFDHVMRGPLAPRLRSGDAVVRFPVHWRYWESI